MPNNSTKQFQERLDEVYHSAMRQYQQNLNKLTQEKVAFIQTNPDHPFPELLFMNVCAPPQRLIITEIS